MRQVVLESIYLHHFKSFIEPTTLVLSNEPGLKFLSGSNLVEPRLGSNGAGKSSIWDGLVWCLFGVGTRGQKAAELVSWGQQQPHVIVTMTIDGRKHHIARYGCPNRLLINQANATQADVDRLVGLSRGQFQQSVLFGQGCDQFLDMPVTARGELLDVVLSLERWAALSDAAGAQATLLGRQATDLERQLAFERGRLAGVEDEEMLQRQSDRWQAEHDTELEDLIEQVTHTKGLITRTPNVKEFDEALINVQDRLRMVRDLEASVAFYERVKVCGECGQPVSEHFAAQQLADLRTDLDKVYGAHSDTAGLEHEIAFLREQRSKAMQAESDNVANTRYLALLVQRAEQHEAVVNPYTERLATLREMYAAVESKIAVLEAEQLTLKGKLLTAEYWKTGFKRVRLYQVKQVLLRMETETANAANALGIGSWRIRFVTEVETKSGSMKPGIQVLVTTPQYDGRWEGFSGGEAQRIRLAVTLGIAAMIQNMAGVNYSFEVFDEASQYLSVEGVEDLLSALQTRAEVTDKSIWVVDHSALSFSGWDAVWCCVKDDRGSRLEVLTQAN